MLPHGMHIAQRALQRTGVEQRDTPRRVVREFHRLAGGPRGMHAREAQERTFPGGDGPALRGRMPGVLQRVVQEGAGRAEAGLGIRDLQLNARFLAEHGRRKRRGAGEQRETFINRAPGDAGGHCRLAHRQPGPKRQPKHGGRLPRGLPERHHPLRGDGDRLAVKSTDPVPRSPATCHVSCKSRSSRAMKGMRMVGALSVITGCPAAHNGAKAKR